MTPERWGRLKELFEAALERAGHDRAAFVAQACAGDDALRSQLSTLLVSYDGAGDFLQAVAPSLAAEPAAERIGPYEIIREIGHGGMGTVYLAARADQEYRKTVAIKVIRRGMDSEFVVRRFRHERQILAGLAHRNIAALLDGGTTEDGLPYFVMEHVDGIPIDRFCDERRLHATKRLELMLEVCQAVQHAHASLVVHRDLKPSNILVTADGQPKLLDFGLAKLIDPTSDSDETAAQHRFLTPSYASPEQIRGARITTPSDVYSLGVVLYVLLTGRRPFGSETSSAEDIARAVCEDLPPRPSAVVDHGAARRQLRGDLDAIVLKALRKEPEKRYASVEELAGDVRRWLEGRPVAARAGTTWYVTGRFLSRHRLAAAVAAAVAAAATIGFVEVVHQRARAERRFGEVRQLANSFLFEFHDAIDGLPGSTRARELVIARAGQYLDSLASEAEDDRALALELAMSYEKLGDVLGRDPSANLGRTSEALAAYRKELEIRERWVDGGSSVAERLDLARSHARIGDMLHRNGDLPAGLASARQAAAIRESLAREVPDNEAVQSDVSVSYSEIGQGLLEQGDAAGAIEQFRSGLAIREALVRTNPEQSRYRRGLGNNYGKLAEALRSAGDLAGASVAYRQALAALETAVAAEPARTSGRISLQQAWQGLGLLEVRRGNLRDALDDFGKAREICEALVAADPANVESKRELAHVLSHIGDALSASGEMTESAATLQDALAIAEQYAARDTADLSMREELAEDERALGVALKGAGRLDAAADHLNKAASNAEALAAQSPDNAEPASTAALANLELGLLEVTLGAAQPSQRLARLREARGHLQRSVDTWARLEHDGHKVDHERAMEASRALADCADQLRALEPNLVKLQPSHGG